MENKNNVNTINIKASDVCKAAIAWYTGKLIFNVGAGIVNLLCKKATSKIEEETERIKVVKNEDEK